MNPPGQRYELVLEAVPGRWQAPPIARLRRLIKACLRAYGLRCVTARMIPPETPGHPPKP